MIHPTEQDVGRRVVYRGHGGEVEEGTITSIRHPDKTFVRYGSGSTSALTKNAQLEWVCPLKSDVGEAQGLSSMVDIERDADLVGLEYRHETIRWRVLGIDPDTKLLRVQQLIKDGKAFFASPPFVRLILKDEQEERRA